MIHSQLFNPKSIAVIGASENASKPGGKVLLNLIKGGFTGNIYAVNKNTVNIEGAISVADLEKLPSVDLAIISIPAPSCIPVVKTLTQQGTNSFILYSAGFGEAGEFIEFDRKEGEITLQNHLTEIADVLVFGGEPYTEPIVAEGPFVMNSKAEIADAYRDYFAGKYGELVES